MYQFSCWSINIEKRVVIDKGFIELLGAAKLQNFATEKYNPKKKNWHNSVDQF